MTKEMDINYNPENKETVKGVADHSMSIDAYYEGFHIKIIQTDPTKMVETYELIKNAKLIISQMKKDGWQPSWNPETNKAAQETQEKDPDWIKDDTYVKKEEEVPVCAYHNKPMTKKQGQYGEFWSCGTKLADGSWCKYRPPKK